MNDAECKAAQILRPGVVWGTWIYPPHITHGLEAVGTLWIKPLGVPYQDSIWTRPNEALA